jgi:hypothetical protein
MMIGFRMLTVSALLLFAGAALAQGPARLMPLVVDGERFFTLEWQATDDGRPVVYGRIRNEFGFGAQKVRLLVDSLDAAGAVTNQTLAYVPGALLPGSRYYFETRVPAPAASYRVQMFQWEWIQAGGGDPR